MKLSTKGRYGLRAMVDLAVYSEKESVSISCIAQRENISESYLEQLAGKLKKAGLIKSTRGAQGGYRLAKPAAEISVGDILRALEGELGAVDCQGLKPEGGCESSDFCVTKLVWQRINDSIAKAVDEITLEELMAEAKKSQERKREMEQSGQYINSQDKQTQRESVEIVPQAASGGKYEEIDLFGQCSNNKDFRRGSSSYAAVLYRILRKPVQCLRVCKREQKSSFKCKKNDRRDSGSTGK